MEKHAMHHHFLSQWCRLKPGMAGHVLLLFATCEVAGVADGLDAASSDKALALFQDIQDKWSLVQTVKYEIESKDIESKEFKESINKTSNDRDLIITKASFEIKGANYAWSTDTYVPATGAHERTNVGAVNNGTLSELFKTQQPLLSVTADPKWQGFVSVTGYNPVMEAFSFLSSDNWSGLNTPSLTLSSVLSRETWLQAAKRLTSLSEEQFDSQACIRIVFGPEIGNHDVVYFSKAGGGFPLDWQHFEGKYLRREVAIKETTAVALPNGKSLMLPHTVVRRDYFDPNNPLVFCTSNQTLSNVTVNQEVSDDDLVIDPSQASLIYDRDSNKMIPVPK
jgi:hypothetical protein